jgi:hypothetical protein
MPIQEALNYRVVTWKMTDTPGTSATDIFDRNNRQARGTETAYSRTPAQKRAARKALQEECDALNAQAALDSRRAACEACAAHDWGTIDEAGVYVCHACEMIIWDVNSPCTSDEATRLNDLVDAYEREHPTYGTK